MDGLQPPSRVAPDRAISAGYGGVRRGRRSTGGGRLSRSTAVDVNVNVLRRQRSWTARSEGDTRGYRERGRGRGRRLPAPAADVVLEPEADARTAMQQLLEVGCDVDH
jgi:hypothetical protein